MPNTDHEGRQIRSGDDRVRVQESELAERVRAEIVSLHEFFVGWFGGALAQDDETFSVGFVRRFDPAFLLIPPAGTLVPLAKLTSSIRDGYGKNPEFRIEIRNVTLRREHGKLVLATYEEWQRNAINSTPPDNGRIASAWFKQEPSAANGLAWLHIHECWLPAELTGADPFDF